MRCTPQISKKFQPIRKYERVRSASLQRAAKNSSRVGRSGCCLVDGMESGGCTTRLPLCIVRKPTVARPKCYRSAVASPKIMVGWSDVVFGRRAEAISQALVRSGLKRPSVQGTARANRQILNRGSRMRWPQGGMCEASRPIPTCGTAFVEPGNRSRPALPGDSPTSEARGYPASGA